MKRYYMILAAIAAMAISAQAQFLGWIEVGDYYNAAELYNGSYFDMAPTNFYLAHTGAQMIYTPDLLTGMEYKGGVKVKYLNFKFYCESFEEIVRNAKVYLQEIDATEFAINDDGMKQFFNFGGLVAEGRYDIDLFEGYGDNMVLALETAEPFSFTPGKSLLVTIVFDAEDDDNCTMGSDYAPFYTSGIRDRAMTYTNNWTSFVDYAQGDNFPDASAMMGCGTNVELPVTEIGFTYDWMLGDVTGDNTVDVADLTSLIAYVLGGQDGPFVIEAANCDGQGGIDVTDVTSLINFILNGDW